MACSKELKLPKLCQVQVGCRKLKFDLKLVSSNPVAVVLVSLAAFILLMRAEGGRRLHE